MAAAFANALGILSEMGRIEEVSAIAPEALSIMRRAGEDYVEEWVYFFWRRGQMEIATQLLGASDAQHARSGEPLQPNEQRLMDAARAGLSAAQGPEAFARDLAAGGALTVAQMRVLIGEGWRNVISARFALLAGLLAVVLACAPFAARAQPAYSAAFVTQTAPSFVAIGTTASVSITMQNTGTATWLRAADDIFLATQEPQDNFYWCIQDNRYSGIDGNRVVLPHDVAPNEQVTFDFVVKPLGCRFAAPSPLRFRMLSRIHETFGEETPDPGVTVSPANAFVSQQVPAAVPVGATVLVTVTFKNVSPVTWQAADGYALVPADASIGTTWDVTSVPLATSVAQGDSATFTFYVTAPVNLGSYDFQWRMATPDGQPFGIVTPATKVQVVAAGPPNYQGLWWASPDGSESGWGINFAHQGDTIFATWFTYDATGKAWWLSMTAPLLASGSYGGALFTATGPPFSVTKFDPTQVVLTQVGAGTLAFSDANTATFTYTVNGITQTRAITRQAFAQLPTCTFGLVSDLTTAYNYQDLWWAAPAQSESGWGVNLTHQGDTIFATWFTYDTDRSSLWLSVTAPKTAAGAYAGTLYRTIGPAFNAVPFKPEGVARTSVGTATFTFSDGNTGVFDYDVNGVKQSRPITREVFAPPGTVCQ